MSHVASLAVPSDILTSEEKIKGLLASHTFDELRKAEITLRADIEVKRRELRHLIGQRYGDIIGSATVINSMNAAVATLREDLLSLKALVNSKDNESNQDDDREYQELSKTNELKVDPITSPMNLPASQFELVLSKRLHAILEAPEVIMKSLSDKRWMEASRLCLRTHRIFQQLKLMETRTDINIIKATPLIETQLSAFTAAKQKVVIGARQYIARTQLHRKVPTEDNLKNSKDLMSFLQKYKQDLEKAKEYELSLMITAIEPSILKPMAGLSATLEHATHGFISALCTIAILEKRPPIQLFIDFLSLRKSAAQFVIDGFETHTGSTRKVNSNLKSIDSLLCEFIRTIQWTIYVVYFAFHVSSKSPKGDSEPSSSTNANDVHSFSSPNYSSTHTPSRVPSQQQQPLSLMNLSLGSILSAEFGPSFASSSELLEIVGNSVLSCPKTPFPMDSLRRMCLEWLKSCVSLIPGSSSDPLLEPNPSASNPNSTNFIQFIQNGKDLAHLESSLVFQIENPLERFSSKLGSSAIGLPYPTTSPTWSGTSTPATHGSGVSTPTRGLRSTNRSGMSSITAPSPLFGQSRPFSLTGTPFSSNGGTSAASLLAGAQLTRWKKVSTHACGENTSLWAVFFQSLFLEQSKKVIVDSFSSISLDGSIAYYLKLFDSASLPFGISVDSSSHFSGKDTPPQSPSNSQTSERFSSAHIDMRRDQSLGDFSWRSTPLNGNLMIQLDQAHGMTDALNALVHEFDSKLSSVLADVRPLIIIEDDVVTADDEGLTSIINASQPSSPNGLNTNDVNQNQQSFTFSGDPKMVVRRRYVASTKKQSLPLLRNCAQQACINVISSLSDKLVDYINSIHNEYLKNYSHQEVNEKEWKDQVQQLDKALFLGRLARALDTHSTQLRKILWLLDTEDSSYSSSSHSESLANGNSSGASLASMIFQASGPKWMDRLSRKPLSSLERESHGKHLGLTSITSLQLSSAKLGVSTAASKSLTKSFHAAYAFWSQATSKYLESILRKQLRTDASYSRQSASNMKKFSTLKRNWLDVAASSTSTTRGNSPSPSSAPDSTTTSNMSVPFQPSNYILVWLRGVERCVFEKGGHLIDRSVLEFFTHCLSNYIFEMYRDLVSHSHISSALKQQNPASIIPADSFALSKEEAVQLWFDLRFLFNMFSRRNLNEPFFQSIAAEQKNLKTWDDLAQTMLWANQTEQLINELKSKLDSIEVSFYNPHINKNSQGFLEQTSLLFASFSSFSVSKASSLTANSTDTLIANTLFVVSNVPRFPTLPISTPSLSSIRAVSNGETAPLTSALPDPGINDIPAVGPTTTNGTMKSNSVPASDSIWDKISKGSGWFS